MTCGEALVGLLERYGVDTVFGIPGVHTVELYRGLSESRIRHITPRHEQGAGFMADGYARASGKPGVCFLITGPGVTNAATAMGQAYSDSVPMLVISAVNASSDLGSGTGRLHELPDQRSSTAGFTVFSHTLLNPAELPSVLARAFAVFDSARPGPVHIQIPTDKLMEKVKPDPGMSIARSRRPCAHPTQIEQAARWLRDATSPLLLLGGGSQDAGDEVTSLAERLACPMVLTLAAKGAICEDHPLCLGASLPFPPVRERIRRADLVLAVGTEFSETDRNLDPDPLEFGGRLIRIDVDPEQLYRTHAPTLPILADASQAIKSIHEAVKDLTNPIGEDVSKQRILEVRSLLDSLPEHFWPGSIERCRVLEVIRRELSRQTIVVTDSTQLAYNANHALPIYQPRTYLTSTTGYGTLGYALPAAIGAGIAHPNCPVAAIVGDGGLQFSLSEMATAKEVEANLVVLVWNNSGYGEIREYMAGKNMAPIGVDLFTPDHVALASAYGWRAESIASLDQLKEAMGRATAQNGPSLLELDARSLEAG